MSLRVLKFFYIFIANQLYSTAIKAPPLERPATACLSPYHHERAPFFSFSILSLASLFLPSTQSSDFEYFFLISFTVVGIFNMKSTLLTHLQVCDTI